MPCRREIDGGGAELLNRDVAWRQRLVLNPHDSLLVPVAKAEPSSTTLDLLAGMILAGIQQRLEYTACSSANLLSISIQRAVVWCLSGCWRAAMRQC